MTPEQKARFGEALENTRKKQKASAQKQEDKPGHPAAPKRTMRRRSAATGDPA